MSEIFLELFETTTFSVAAEYFRIDCGMVIASFESVCVIILLILHSYCFLSIKSFLILPFNSSQQDRRDMIRFYALFMYDI